jgi:hypothetical protein
MGLETLFYPGPAMCTPLGWELMRRELERGLLWPPWKTRDHSYKDILAFLERGADEPGVVAHFCKPSYLGGTDWEDHGSKPAWAKH